MDVSAIIAETAQRYGLDPEYMLKKAGIEAGQGLNPRAQNPYSSAGGLFQFVDKTWNQYGRGADKYDPRANADAAARLTLDNRNSLRAALGRDPTPGELYLAHQQGAGGAAALLKDPNRIVSGDAIRLNGGRDGMRAGDFAAKWTGRFDGAPMQAPQAASMASAAPPAPQMASLEPQAAPGALSPEDVADVFRAFAPQPADRKRQKDRPQQLVG